MACPRKSYLNKSKKKNTFEHIEINTEKLKFLKVQGTKFIRHCIINEEINCEDSMSIQ